MPHDDPDALIRRTEAIKNLMGMSRTSAWRRERDDPTFPKPVQTGPNSWAYRVGDVRRWIATRPVRDKFVERVEIEAFDASADHAR